MEAFSKVGTPLYMAPEILCAETIMCADKTSSGRYIGEKHVLVKGYDWKSEVWSLGCVLYELVTLRSPFKEQGQTLSDLVRKCSKGEYAPISEKYTRDLHRLIHAMLNPDPEARPSMKEIAKVATGRYEMCLAEKVKTKARSAQATRARQSSTLEALDAELPSGSDAAAAAAVAMGAAADAVVGRHK